MRQTAAGLGLVLLTLACGTAAAQGGGGMDGHRLSLTGLTSVRVVIERAEGLGELGAAPASELLAAVRAALKGSGLEIVDDPDGTLTPPGFPTVHVAARAEPLRAGGAGLLYNLNFNLTQQASLVRRAGIMVNAITWHTGKSGRTADAKGVVDALTKCADELVADYRAVNAKK